MQNVMHTLHFILEVSRNTPLFVQTAVADWVY